MADSFYFLSTKRWFIGRINTWRSPEYSRSFRLQEFWWKRNVKHSNSESFIVSEFSSSESRHKRRKTLAESEARKKIWIISGRVKSKGQINGFKKNGCGGNKGGEGGKKSTNTPPKSFMFKMFFRGINLFS